MINERSGASGRMAALMALAILTLMLAIPGVGQHAGGAWQLLTPSIDAGGSFGTAEGFLEIIATGQVPENGGVPYGGEAAAGPCLLTR